MKLSKLKVVLAISALIILGVIIGLFFYIQPDSNKTPIILKGVVVTPDEVINPGWVLVNNRKIKRVSLEPLDIPGAIVIDTGGIILPGLVDLHNHVIWNVIPRWDPNRNFLNRYEWRLGNKRNTKIRQAINNLRDDYLCQMNTYGEVRALAGGTTSVIGSVDQSCIRGLVRNLDYYSDFYLIPINQDQTHLKNVIDLPSNTQTIEEFLNKDSSNAFFIHLAEGVGPAMRAEFDQMAAQALLTNKTVIIHGVALTPDQFRQMSEQGASLIWSPRSNLELYGQTADILSAIDAGVTIAISPDWAITGSANLLDELRFADEWNATYLNNYLTDKQLVEMVTSIPAAIAGISEHAGTISAGKQADILVISGDTTNPYRAIIEAGPENVKLVLVDGVPLYGETSLMEGFFDLGELSQLSISGNTKALHLSNFNHLVTELDQALSVLDFGLAPITEDIEIDISAMIVDIEPESKPVISNNEISWNDAVYFFGEYMTVCGPVEDIYYADGNDQVPSNFHLGLPYPNINRFTIHIPQSARESFPEDFMDNIPLTTDLCATGEIVAYQGIAEIIVTDYSQIKYP